jgi:hypothetical protein
MTQTRVIGGKVEGLSPYIFKSFYFTHLGILETKRGVMGASWGKTTLLF